MTTAAETARLRVQQLIHLTRTLTERLSHECDAMRERRPQDIASGMEETQFLANQYRRESAQAKASPDFLKSIAEDDRKELVEATAKFETILSEHAQAIEAARTISEGLVRAIASEVAGARAQGTGYGASGQANRGDSRAVALNRTA